MVIANADSKQTMKPQYKVFKRTTTAFRDIRAKYFGTVRATSLRTDVFIYLTVISFLVLLFVTLSAFVTKYYVTKSSIVYNVDQANHHLSIAERERMKSHAHDLERRAEREESQNLSTDSQQNEEVSGEARLNSPEIHSTGSSYLRSALAHKVSFNFQEFMNPTCYKVGRNPDFPKEFMSMNSRVLCVLKSMCLAMGKGSAQPQQPIETLSCSVKYAESATQSLFWDDEWPTCPRFMNSHVKSMYPDLDLVSVQNNTRGHFSYETILFIPKYPWLNNIFHMARAMLFAFHIFWNAETYHLNKYEISIASMSSKLLNHDWAKGLIDLVSREEPRLKIQSARSVLGDSKQTPQCFSSLVLLGKEGRFDSLYFLNDSDVYPMQDPNNSYIPRISRDALTLKDIVYKSVFKESMFRDHTDLDYTIEAPPLVLAYLKRKPTSLRNFQREDPVRALLKAVSIRYNLELRTVSFDSLTFKQQLEEVSDIGFAFGIHGANLVNSLFMAPFAVLFEIFPFKYVRSYYVGGGNSGLKYYSWEVRSGAARNCSYEQDIDCRLWYRDQPLKLTTQDFRGIENNLNLGAEYLTRLNQMNNGELVIRGDSGLVTFTLRSEIVNERNRMLVQKELRSSA